nr:ribulose-phosphate 3-epimerase [Deinococcus maricopensis]
MSRSPRLAPSILSCDFSRLGDELRAIQQGGADLVHVDVMDGLFVPNISFGLPILAAARRATDQYLDVHLMIEQPERYIDAFVQAGADGLTVHVEATRHLHRVVQQIRAHGRDAGVTLNPGTPLETLRPVLADVQRVLIMSVNPGFGGQAFIPSALDRIRAVRAWLDDVNPDAHLEVDGGVGPANIRALMDAGANEFVAGSSVFGADGPAEGLRRLREATQ